MSWVFFSFYLIFMFKLLQPLVQRYDQSFALPDLFSFNLWLQDLGQSSNLGFLLDALFTLQHGLVITIDLENVLKSVKEPIVLLQHVDLLLHLFLDDF